MLWRSDVLSEVATRLPFKSFEAGPHKRTEPIEIDYPNGYVWCVALGKLLQMAGHRRRNPLRRHNSERRSGFWKTTRKRLGLQDSLREQGNQSIAATFRRALHLNDVLLLT